MRGFGECTEIKKVTETKNARERKQEDEIICGGISRSMLDMIQNGNMTQLRERFSGR